MKRVLRTAMMALLAFALCFGALAPTASAATSTAFDVKVPIKINVTGSQPVDGAFAEFTVKALTEGAPMPNGATGAELIWVVPVNAMGLTTHVLEISFPELGVYRYTIQMTGGTYFDAETDGTVYTMEVYSLAEDYDDSVQISSGNKKFDSLDYTIPLMDLKVSKKWIDQDSSRPSSVNIAVLNSKSGEKVSLKTIDFDKDGVSGRYTFPELTLSSKNSWQSSWSGLDSRGAYKVKEVKVPAGYTVSYKYSGGIWYVTNTGSLLQTGQLNWPIPVLCTGGFLLLAVGMLLMKRKEEKTDD